MCGIAGVVGCADAAMLVDAMMERIAHRGRDGRGVWSSADGSLSLGHERMAVIGIANGHQPLMNEDETLILAVNGEIYNYRELRAELEHKGHIFRSDSDSEVIVHLYEEDPENFTDRLCGMFAFALVDTVRNALLLVRDRLGQKPLFYSCNGKELTFASEITAFAGAELKLNKHSIHHFFSYQFIPVPETVYDGVSQLAPATLVKFEWDSGKLSSRRYWNLDFSSKCALSLREAQTGLRNKLNIAVSRRLISEVPLGGFLSGGLDSAIVASTMLEQSDASYKFISIGFRDQAYDESEDIAVTVEWLKRRYGASRVDHELVVVDIDDFDAMAECASFYGQPFADASMLPTLLLCRKTRECGLKVALSGDGADELFGGYERYVAMNLARRWHRLKWLTHLLPRGGGERSVSGRLRRFFEMLNFPDRTRYFSLVAHGSREVKQEIYGSGMTQQLKYDSADILSNLADHLTAENPVERCAELDLCSYLPGDVLTKVDIASMRQPLEVRSPFLDHEIAEFAASLPWKYKQSGFERKIILRKAFPELPERIRNGRKRGFGVPLAELLRGAWKGAASDLLLNGHGVKDGWFYRPGLAEMWKEHQSGRSDYSYTLFSALVFELFLQRHNC